MLYRFLNLPVMFKCKKLFTFKKRKCKKLLNLLEEFQLHVLHKNVSNNIKRPCNLEHLQEFLSNFPIY